MTTSPRDDLVERPVVYAFDTPQGCLDHLQTFWERPTLGREWRIRFAWKPVDIWRINERKYSEQTGKRIWLREVVEILTLCDGWVAYERHQMVLADPVVAQAARAALKDGGGG